MMEAYSAGVNVWLADKAPEDVAAEYLFLNQLRVGLGAAVGRIALIADSRSRTGS